MPRPSAPSASRTEYTKSAGQRPLPGYVLISPLGRGGFGEVWKCEAPGGLHKAVKFVVGDETESVVAGASESSQLRQEFDAFQQVKSIRHPFLLSLERVELIDGELIMVMELADQQLGDRLEECRAAGRAGIPREELICYMYEAAEALDVIGAKYGLQHLDVKPANLFVTAGHVKVGDYGLVSRLDGGSGANTPGLTPRYAAPEVLRGQIHTRSDQYSLALVYFELLTGAFPYNARNVQQMMMQHLSAAPDLTALPAADRGPVGIALAKDPDTRTTRARRSSAPSTPPGGRSWSRPPRGARGRFRRAATFSRPRLQPRRRAAPAARTRRPATTRPPRRGRRGPRPTRRRTTCSRPRRSNRWRPGVGRRPRYKSPRSTRPGRPR
jgi:eukaryotic-like serine/threonine-protein kinase